MHVFIYSSILGLWVLGPPADLGILGFGELETLVDFCFWHLGPLVLLRIWVSGTSDVFQTLAGAWVTGWVHCRGWVGGEKNGMRSSDLPNVYSYYRVVYRWFIVPLHLYCFCLFIVNVVVSIILLFFVFYFYLFMFRLSFIVVSVFLTQQWFIVQHRILNVLLSIDAYFLLYYRCIFIVIIYYCC